MLPSSSNQPHSNQPNPSGPAATCILADDLTGACDAAAAFAARGISTEVRLQPKIDDISSNVIALSTATRDATPACAEAAVDNFAQHSALAQFAYVFKKIDSVFRGNTFVEIAAAVRAFPHRVAVIAPASPRHGRTCTNATLHVQNLQIQDLTGRTSTYLRPALEAAGLHPAWLAACNDPARLAAAMQAAQPRALFCNAASDQNLATIVKAAQTLDHPILWIGSSGLAHALAESLHPALLPTPHPPQGLTLIFTGSDHPVTQDQLTHLRAHHPETFILRVERNHTPDAEILNAVRPFGPAAIGCLFINGGDTALQVCRALSINALHLSGEFAPGIPIATASGGPYDGTTVILKSGGFGAIDLLARIVSYCSAHQEQHA